MERLTMKERKIIQIGIVVKDLEKSLQQYCDIFNLGPWDIFTYGPPEMTNCTYRGKPSEWSAIIGFAWIGDRQIEIIQPLLGPNIYYDFIEKKGEGLHHIKEWVDDPQKTIKEYEEKGVSVIQSGEFDGRSFYYLDTEPYLGITLEIVKGGPSKHREPDRQFPVE
jgi:catechol 2,3-dioxygenase-like lactoylglutathione lyase family enzyme